MNVCHGQVDGFRHILTFFCWPSPLMLFWSVLLCNSIDSPSLTQDGWLITTDCQELSKYKTGTLKVKLPLHMGVLTGTPKVKERTDWRL